MEKRDMKFNKEAVSEFKQFFHGERKATFQLFPERPECIRPAKVGESRLSETDLERLQEWNGSGAAVSMMINRGQGKERKAQNVTKITSVFVDADGKVELETLKQAFIPPHLIVESSPGRYHAYWRVKGMPLTKFEAQQKRLAEIFNSDPQVCDLPRAMRVPGSINWKRDKPFVVRVVYKCDGVRRIDWEEFAKLMNNGPLDEKPRLAKDGGECGGPKSIDTESIKKALGKIPSDDRGIWLKVGMAIHSALPNSVGHQLWDEWSRTSNNFNAEDQEQTWRHFKPDGGIRFATLFWLAERLSGAGSIEKTIWLQNEIEMGKLFARNYADVLRFVQSEDAWYVWDGARWRRDKIASQNYAQNFLLAEREARLKAGLRGDGNLSVANVKNILNVARVETVLQATRADFDTRPDILAVRNGVVELPTGTFRAGMPDDMISCCANVAFDPDADCPTWDRFLKEITDGDRDMRRFLRRAVGYTLYGHTAEQKMFVIIGSGANGKGVFLHTLAKILGDYAGVVQASLLRPNYGNANGPTPALAAIKGRRMLMCSEWLKNKPFDEAFVKQLTGNDPVSGRSLYAEQEEFVPVGKLWLMVNNMPKVRFDDSALWRRVVPIPFMRRFVGRKADPRLEKKLEAERSGILNWALTGAELYAKEGRLELCDSCLDFRKDLRGAEDTVGAWIESECKRDSAGAIQARNAYDAYAIFIKGEKREPVSRTEFKATLDRKGFRHRRRNSFNEYQGLRLRHPLP
jgi:P4 family phage/plasmid primase-like protien